MVSDEVIRTDGLVKSYRTRTALRGLDLAVQRGEVFGFLGPNGAGKTTTIRLLLDLLRPTDGRIEVLGSDPRTGGGDTRARIGFLPGELPIRGRQNAGELLRFLGRLRGGVSHDRIEELATRLGLDLSVRVRGLSKGNKQKIGLVQAFMHQPELLVLDEPTSGLDPLMQQEFLALVREAGVAGQTVFMSSHVLSEVQQAADRVGIIRAGTLVAVSGVEELREHARRRVEITFTEPVSVAEFTDLPGVADPVVDGTSLTCEVDGRADALVKAAARHTVVDLVSEEPDLEEMFFAHYADNNSEEVTEGVR